MPRFAQRFMPLAWARGYKRDWLRGDISAGLTTAVMLIPQAMAYAMLAGLDPIIGLYASVAPLIAYALFASSKDLAVGPVAIVSLMVAAGLAPLAAGGTMEYLALAGLLALMVGVIQLVMGAARLGFLVNFLSHPVIAGFVSAAAIVIGASQLKHLLGIEIAGGAKVHEIFWQALSRFDEVHGLTFAVGLTAIVVLMGLKKWKPRFPGALFVVVVSTVLTALLGWEEIGLRVVGEVPAGFPGLSMPLLDMGMIAALLPIALTISFVGFMESISIAKAIATRKGYEVDANKELVGLGAANIAGSVMQAYPVTGGFSRTAVNASAGARSPLASVFTAAIVGLTLLFFTGLFYYLPQAVLAAIIMTAVFGLVDIKEVRHLWKVRRTELIFFGITFVGTLTLGIEEGILIGVAASLVGFFVAATRPNMVELGRLPNSTAYRDVNYHPEAITHPGVIVARLDGQLFFANVSFVKDRLEEFEAKRGEPLRAVIIDASGISSLDSTAAAALGEIASSHVARDVRFILSNVKSPVRSVMERAGLDKSFGVDCQFITVEDAVEAVL